MSSRTEEDILAIEREYWQLPDLPALARRLAAVEQSVAQIWNYGPSGGAAPPPPNTTFSGFLDGCFSHHVDSPAVSLTRTSDGLVLWTGTATAGSGYSGSIYLAANTACTLDATAPDATRQANLSVSRTVNFGTSNSLAAAVFAAQANYYCAISACTFPLKSTLQLTDTGTGFTYNLTKASAGVNWTWLGPVPSAGPTISWTFNGVILTSSYGNPTSTGLTCPDATHAFLWAYNVTFGGGHGLVGPLHLVEI